MRNIGGATAEIIAFPAALKAAPAEMKADKPRRVFTVLMTALDSVARSGSPGCAATMLRADAQFEIANDHEARTLLRMRCGRCKSRCAGKLAPVITQHPA